VPFFIACRHYGGCRRAGLLLAKPRVNVPPALNFVKLFAL